MSDIQEEIKEILDKCTPFLFGDEVDKLLDYITNLQEENKKIKELCDKYEEEHNTTFEYWKHLIKEDYKTRIDKAIEYINEMCLCSDGYCDYGDDLRPEHIVNILQGSDKE